MAHATIQVGSRGRDVELAQKSLADRGYPIGPAGVDGIFGMHTLRGVLNYQGDRATGTFWALSYPLVVDGIVGPQTWGRLAPDTIQNGSRGTGVRLLQSILRESANPQWDPGKVDGIFGPLTEAAVKNFQTDLALKVDGIVGPVTWTALWS